MAANLMEMFKYTVGDLLVKHASESLAESAESVGIAVEDIASTLMGTLIEKGSTDAGVRSLMDYLINNKVIGTFLSQAKNLLSGGHETTGLMSDGTGILKYLIGDKLGAAVDIIAARSGLRTSSATSLFKMSSPFFLDILGKYFVEKNLDALAMRSLLFAQRDETMKSLPKGMDLVLGLISPSDPDQKAPQPSIQSSTSKNSFSKFLPWIVLLLASFGLFYFVQKGCSSNTTTNDKESSLKTNTADPAQDGLKTYKLPGGITMKASSKSFTGRLAEYLESPADDDTCLNFDQVKFESGTSKLTASSEAQLNQLVLLLKAYENSKISLLGYTDNIGDDDQNKELSRDMVKAIKTWLTDHYIAPGRIETKGMGE